MGPSVSSCRRRLRRQLRTIDLQQEQLLQLPQHRTYSLGVSLAAAALAQNDDKACLPDETTAAKTSMPAVGTCVPRGLGSSATRGKGAGKCSRQLTWRVLG